MDRGGLQRALVVVAVLAASVALEVRADDAAESRFFDGIAREAYEHHRYPEALEAFLRAHRAAPSGRSLYNIALCAQLAHRDAMAFAYFEELLARPAEEGEDAIRRDAAQRREALTRRLAIVSVTSTPPGATIYVDQRDHGSFGTTPRRIALPAGAHHVELVLADHEDAARDVSAVVGQATSVEAPLVAFRGAVTITQTIAGASIVARRSGIGEDVAIVPGVRTELDVGRYTLVVHADGYRDATLELGVTRGADERRAITLEPLPVPTGRLLVTTGDVHARVRVDGVDRAETPARVASLPLGTHEVTVSADGFLDWSGAVEVEEDRTAFVSVTMTPSR